MKNKILCLFFLFFLCSCSERILGPNYNTHPTHNSTMAGRNSVVNREDSRMKKAMARERIKASNNLPKRKKVRKKRGRKFIN